MSCQTCLSDLRSAPGFVPPCCNVPICEACVAANPRLSTWIPCLRCGSTTSSRGKTPPVPAGVKTTQVEGQRKTKKERKREAEEDQFVLVGSDEDEDDAAEEAVDREDGKEGGEADRERGEGKKGDDGNINGTDRSEGVGEKRPPSPELVEVKHVPQRGETLLTIARKYATDPHTLLSLNDLPHAALYANPSLIRTRPSLIVSRRLVNARSSVDVTETPERQAERALARFQAVSKAEEAVARAYLALHEGGSAAGEGFQRSLERGGGDTVWSYDEEMRIRGQDEKEKVGRTDASGPEAALEHYYDDEAWEAGASRPAKGKDRRWTVVGAVLPQGVRTEK